MLAIKGFFAGEKSLPLEKIPNKKKSRVIITFIEEADNDSEIRDFSSQADSFYFWNDERKDCYRFNEIHNLL
jgi:hypothetical protein